MAAKYEEMRDPEFEAAFNEDNSGAAASAPAGGDAGGMNLPESGEGGPAEESAGAAETGDTSSEGTPAAVVIVAEEGTGTPGETGSESSANDAAAAEAKAVNDEANAAASTNKSEATTTGEQEAGKEAAGEKPAEAAAPAEGTVAEEAAETPAVETAEVAAGEGDPFDLSDVPPEDMQKAKSWVGRLKRLEADLKAKAAAGGEKPAEATEKAADDLEQVATEALGENEQLADAADQAAMDVAAGKMTPDEARRRLAEDFGDEFLGYIETIARDYAGQQANQAVGDRLSKIEQDTQGVIDHLKNRAERAHFQEIYDAHPDFQEIGAEPGFQEYVAATGQQAVVDNGSAADINKLLADYKATKQAPAAGEQQGGEGAAPAQEAVAAAAQAEPDAVDQNAVDAAEGVRSAGLRLPEKPVKAEDDFKSAWEKF